MATQYFKEGDLASTQDNTPERTAAMAKLKSLCLTDFQARKDFGTSGKPITVMANMFQTRFKGQGPTILHYDIAVKPAVKAMDKQFPVRLLRQIWDLLPSVLSADEKKGYNVGAYDGRKNFFTPIALPAGDVEKTVIVTVPDDDPNKKPAAPGPDGGPDDGRKFKVTWKKVANIDLETVAKFCRGEKQATQELNSMLTSIMAINVMLRDDPMKRFVQRGGQGQRFFSEVGAENMSNGAVVGKGFFQQGLPGIQLDTAFSAFIAPGPLLQVAENILGFGRAGAGGRGGRGGPRGGRGGPPDRGGRGGGRGGGMGGGGGGGSDGGIRELSQQDQMKLSKIIRGAKFKVTHRTSSREFTIMSLTNKSAEQCTFKLTSRTGGNDETMNVVQYFQKTYNTTVRFPRLPCVQYGNRNFVPMEFVEIVPFNTLPPTKLTGDQTAEMIKISARPPPERRDNIMKWRQTLAYDQLDKVKAWGMEVQKNMTEVNARVLQPPKVQYAGQGAQGAISPRAGSWNLVGKRFFKAGAPLKAWSVVSFDRYFGTEDMQKFIAQMVTTLDKAGCKVETPRPPLLGPENPGQDNGMIGEALRKAAKAAFEAGGKLISPQLIVIIMPRKDTAFYEDVKRAASTQLLKPVVTQCLVAQKLKNDRGIDQYCGNVSMKIHAKLGGVTHCVPRGEMPGITQKTMLIGADVTHPPPVGMGQEQVKPSIAATVAAVDGENNKFAAEIRVQRGRCEIIVDLAEMITKQIKLFQSNSKTLPDSIIFYRDGVGEHQYAEVVQEEVRAIKKACHDIDPKYQPKLTFVICAKRHHMRFFAKDPGDVDRSQNLPAGTMVDQKVCHPYAFDFYLQAHAGLVGTARPTHYAVLVDENNYNPNDLQRLTNAMCYNYARATRSVSIVSVAYYADIICTKARAMLYNDDDSYAPSESTAAGGHKASSTGESFDKMAVANLLNKNPEFTKVAWYM